MKLIIGSVLSFYSLASYSIGFNCNFLVNGDFRNSKSFSYGGTSVIEEANGPFKTDLEMVNIGSVNNPDSRLKIRLFRGDDYSMGLFEVNAEQPFVSSRMGGDFAQVQCWSKGND